MKKSIAILLILAFTSCQKNDIEKVSPKAFDIKNVKEWYLSKTSSAKLNGDDPNLIKEIMWDQAKNGTHFDGTEVWIMPVKYSNKTVKMNFLVKNKDQLKKTKFKDKDEFNSDNALEFLTIKKKNNIEIYEIENVITAEYKDKNKKEEFEGLVYVFDTNNKFKSGFLIENNKVKYLLSETKNTKVSGLVCNYIITTTSYTYTVTYGGNNTSAPYNNGYAIVTAQSCYYDNQNSGPYVSYSGLVSNSTGSASGVSGYSSVGKFMLSLEDQIRFPRFTEIVRNMQSYVAQNPQVNQALMKYSGYSFTDIMAKLSFGRGPLIVIKPMDYSYGYFNKLENPNVININSAFIFGLEFSNLKSTQDATAFLLAVTVLHEFVHQARYANGLTGPYEYGFGFGNEAFGLIINSQNASQYTYRFFKK